jgi:UPF0755 protein
MRVSRRLRSFLLLATLLGGAAACATNDQTNVTLTIRRGSTFREAAESLAAHDVVISARLFGFYAARRKLDRKIEYGTYLIRRGASWEEILTALQLGKGLVNRVTIVEGLPLWEIVPVLAKGLGVSADSLEAAVRDPALLRRLGVPKGLPTAEGYLFPDTYDFPVGISARQAVDLMVRRFERIWRTEWTTRLDAIGMNRHQVVTLASIVEKEVRRGEERPVVAAVYTNRLKKRMALQADPTIQYAQRRRPGRVLYRDLRVDSPYNTYRRVGLPPGPIASPGEASLEAALYPANVPYLFFVARPDGRHEFRVTYSEHLQAIEVVRSQARRDTLAARAAAARQRDLEAAQKAVGITRPPPDSAAAVRPPDGRR